MLVLLIGDLYIPQRAADIPAELKKLLVPGKIHQIVCTGNITSRETFDYLRSIAAEITVARGDLDEV